MDDQLYTRIRRSRQLLENPYSYLDDKGEFDASPQVQDRAADKESRRSSISYQRNMRLATLRENNEPLAEDESGPIRVVDRDTVFGNIRRGKRLTRREIEEIARNFHRKLWAQRTTLCSQLESITPLDVLDPEIALTSIGFRLQETASLGEHDIGGERLEVAGQIDARERTVGISLQFPAAVRKFTAAHELAHALLHDGIGLHRDRALDGAPPRGGRSRIEYEADQFAVFFLMPGIFVRTAFEEIFDIKRFVLSEETAFRLNAGGFDALKGKSKQRLFLARLLAGTKQYDGIHFVSLCERFGVSNLTMAIRLEELELIRN